MALTERQADRILEAMDIARPKRQALMRQFNHKDTTWPEKQVILNQLNRLDDMVQRHFPKPEPVAA
jgi:hypothetical protein